MEVEGKVSLTHKWYDWFANYINDMDLVQGARISVKQHALLALTGLETELRAEFGQPLILGENTKNSCWFCDEVDDDLVFDTEFDTYVHVDCIRTRLKEDPFDPEANQMKYLFKPL